MSVSIKNINCIKEKLENLMTKCFVLFKAFHTSESISGEIDDILMEIEHQLDLIKNNKYDELIYLKFNKDIKCLDARIERISLKKGQKNSDAFMLN